MNWRIAVLFSGLFLAQLSISSGTYAEEPITMSLEQALDLGLKNNLQLQAIRESLVQASAGIEIAQGRFDPNLEMSLSSSSRSTPIAVVGSPLTDLDQQQVYGAVGVNKLFTSGLSANLSLSSSRDETNDTTAGLDPSYRTTLGLTLQQPLLRDFGSHVNTVPLQQSNLVDKQTLLDYQRQSQLLAYAVQSAYINLSQAQQIADYQRHALSLAEELVAGNRKKLKFGQVPVSELQQAETAVEARRSELLFAEQGVAISREALIDLLDVEIQDQFRVQPLTKPALPEISLKDAVKIALDKRADLTAFGLEMQRQDLFVDLKKNQRLPRLDLLAGADLQGLAGEDNGLTNNSFTGDWFDSGSSALDADHQGWMVGVNFSYPLGNRAANSALRQAQSQQRQSRLNKESKASQITSEVRTAWAIMQSGLQRTDSAKRNVDLATKTLDQENQRVQAGLSDSFRLLIIQDSLISANIRLAQAIGDAHRGFASLEQAMGVNLPQI